MTPLSQIELIVHPDLFKDGTIAMPFHDGVERSTEETAIPTSFIFRTAGHSIGNITEDLKHKTQYQC